MYHFNIFAVWTNGNYLVIYSYPSRKIFYQLEEYKEKYHLWSFRKKQTNKKKKHTHTQKKQKKTKKNKKKNKKKTTKKELSQLMRLWYLSHRRLAKAWARLRIMEYER